MSKRFYWGMETRRQRKAKREAQERERQAEYDRWAEKIRNDPDSPEYKAWSDYRSGNPPPLDTQS